MPGGEGKRALTGGSTDCGFTACLGFRELGQHPHLGPGWAATTASLFLGSDSQHPAARDPASPKAWEQLSGQVSSGKPRPGLGAGLEGPCGS